MCPQYKWRCRECRELIETIQSIKDTDDPKHDGEIIECPECGKKNWAKVLQKSANRWRFMD